MTYQSLPFRKSFRLGALVVALLALSGLTGLARAEDAADPPRLQQAGGYNIEFLAPVLGGNHDAEDNLLFRFKVTDAQNRPVSGLDLSLTGIRDYSGQVKKEHNGPRTPNVGPVRLVPAQGGAAGEYEAAMRFGFNGHWYVRVEGPGLDSEKVTFRLPIGTAENKGAGINFDWLVWVGVALVVASIVAIIGRKGEVFPTPVAELEPPIPATR